MPVIKITEVFDKDFEIKKKLKLFKLKFKGFFAFFIFIWQSRQHNQAEENKSPWVGPFV